MQQRTFRSRNDFSHSMQQILARMMLWILVVIMLLQQMKAIDAAKFKGDNCISKNKPGICREWSECPVLKTLIESGEYTNRDVVNCGFSIKEELICCPVRTETKIETSTDENIPRFTEPTITATTQAPVKDFWLDLLQNTTTSTTQAAPDFWLDLLNPTTTTTTTIKPLIIGEQKLNESSEFFDFNALLGGNQNAALKRESQTTTDDIKSNNNNYNNNPAHQGIIASSANGRGNLNTGPVNINQWNFEQTGNDFQSVPSLTNFNNGRGNNGPNIFPGNNNGNFGWGQANFNRGQNMGRGPFNNNGRGHINGRGPHNNNGRGRGNQNLGFVSFPQNNMRPNNFFGEDDTQKHSPGTPVNNMQEQNPNIQFPNGPTNNRHTSMVNDEDEKVEDLIKTVFATNTGTANTNAESSSANNQGNPNTKTIEDSIVSIFNVNKPKASAINLAQQASSPQPVVWLRPQDNHNNHEVEYIQFSTPQHQMELNNQHVAGHFQIIPAADNQIDEEAPSTSFIQQPVVVETWSANPHHRHDFSPVQVVYENLVNSGMDIVKAQDYQVENVLNQQQQQFGQQPTQLVVVQPPQPMQQFVQQPEYIYQQGPQAPQNFAQQISQQLAQEPLQMESSNKEPRSAATLQQFVQQTNNSGGPILNVQSPPSNILDPFKPFEFRPPPSDDAITFLEDNNSLSPNSATTKTDTDKKTTTDRPAVRACRRIDKGLVPSLSQHILGGIPAELGEFPHMVAIGYSRIGGNDKPPYDIRCGGTLIDKRFVLTAAHCVSERENVPSIVRLGVVNFTDVNQMNAAVELRIKETYIPDDYLTRLTYNDIAILELERDVEYSEYVYPVCLYTDERDPDTSIKLWVTGWGTVNTTTRSFSDILLKAPLHTSPLENCNKSFKEYGLNRRVPEGIIRSQFCAEDKDQIKDACQGDSGGPLQLVVDESYKKYRLVGIVSSGFGCASSTPGLYTRVAAFLDFIEKIVWPNGGD